MQKRTTRFITTILSASALTFGMHAAIAQEGGASMPQPQAPAPMEVDDKTVDNFIGAYTDLRKIHSEYAAQLQNVQDPEKATELQQEAQQKMQQAVTDNDMTVEEYQQVAQQIGQNEELRSRIQAELNATGEH